MAVKRLFIRFTRLIVWVKFYVRWIYHQCHAYRSYRRGQQSKKMELTLNLMVRWHLRQG